MESGDARVTVKMKAFSVIFREPTSWREAKRDSKLGKKKITTKSFPKPLKIKILKMVLICLSEKLVIFSYKKVDIQRAFSEIQTNEISLWQSIFSWTDTDTTHIHTHTQTHIPLPSVNNYIYCWYLNNATSFPTLQWGCYHLYWRLTCHNYIKQF